MGPRSCLHRGTRTSIYLYPSLFYYLYVDLIKTNLREGNVCQVLLSNPKCDRYTLKGSFVCGCGELRLMLISFGERTMMGPSRADRKNIIYIKK